METMVRKHAEINNMEAGRPEHESLAHTEHGTSEGGSPAAASAVRRGSGGGETRVANFVYVRRLRNVRISKNVTYCVPIIECPNFL